MIVKLHALQIYNPVNQEGKSLSKIHMLMQKFFQAGNSSDLGN